MNLWYNMGQIAFLPVLAISYFSRCIWTGVLAVLAGLGVMQARSDKAVAEEPKPQVMCYAQPRQRELFSDSRWVASLTMQTWAVREQTILNYARSGKGDFSVIQKEIADANTAYANVQADVKSGILSQETYTMAGKILEEWHKDMALSYTAVECYEATFTPPMISDVSQRLFTIQKLSMEGKLTPVVVAQTEQGIRESLGEELSPRASAELAQLLVELLGFGN